MDKVTLEAQTRVADGSRPARRIRRAGSIPAILSGHGMSPLPIQVGVRELLKVLHTKSGVNVLIDLDLKGQPLKEKTCLIKALQHNPVTDEISHIDFTLISMTEKITVKVPLVATQSEEAEGVKMGGVLDIVHGL
jgi:large subunit ribosomal protein L25